MAAGGGPGRILLPRSEGAAAAAAGLVHALRFVPSFWVTAATPPELPSLPRGERGPSSSPARNAAAPARPGPAGLSGPTSPLTAGAGRISTVSAGSKLPGPSPARQQLAVAWTAGDGRAGRAASPGLNRSKPRSRLSESRLPPRSPAGSPAAPRCCAASLLPRGTPATGRPEDRCRAPRPAPGQAAGGRELRCPPFIRARQQHQGCRGLAPAAAALASSCSSASAGVRPRAVFPARPRAP